MGIIRIEITGTVSDKVRLALGANGVRDSQNNYILNNPEDLSDDQWYNIIASNNPDELSEIKKSVVIRRY